MNVCVDEEWGASCDNSEHQQEEHIDGRERDGTEDEYQ